MWPLEPHKERAFPTASLTTIASTSVQLELRPRPWAVAVGTVRYHERWTCQASVAFALMPPSSCV